MSASSQPHDPHEMGELLLQHRATLARWIQREATGILRFESVEDIVQGVHVRALASGSFEYRGAEPFLAWLRTLMRRLRRGSGRALDHDEARLGPRRAPLVLAHGVG